MEQLTSLNIYLCQIFLPFCSYRCKSLTNDDNLIGNCISIFAKWLSFVQFCCNLSMWFHIWPVKKVPIFSHVGCYNRILPLCGNYLDRTSTRMVIYCWKYSVQLSITRLVKKWVANSRPSFFKTLQICLVFYYAACDFMVDETKWHFWSPNNFLLNRILNVCKCNDFMM